jgi:hypothetical protein
MEIKSNELQRVNKIMETLRDWGLEFVLATLKKLQLVALNHLPFVHTL